MIELNPPKSTNRFRLSLNPFELGNETYDGCNNVTQEAYGPFQAITTTLKKVNHMNFADHYITSWENGKSDASLILEYHGRDINLNDLPKEVKKLENVRKFVKEKTGMKAKDVNSLSYGKLYDMYEKLTAPVPEPIKITPTITAKAGTVQDDMFPEYSKVSQWNHP
jgi:hypothetical protein